MKDYIKRVIGLFFALCVVFVPFIHESVQLKITGFIFEIPVRFLSNLFFDRPIVLMDFSSDTRSLLLLLSVLFFVAVFSAFAIKKHSQKLLLLFRTVTVYFLSFVLFKYGFEKMFINQFYQPEPNILYTPFGNLDRDILYWSVMGLAPVYSFILGVTEVTAAILILFVRTRFVGLLLAIIALLQIVVINFSFDISVKMFSVLLLAMVLFTAWRQLKALFGFLLMQKAQALPLQQSFNMPVYIKAPLKFFIVGLMLLTILYPMVITYKSKPKPYAAYKVEHYMLHGVEWYANIPVKRIFFHSKHYVIFQAEDDSMTDFHYTINEAENTIVLSNYEGTKKKMTYSIKNGLLTLTSDNGMIITATLIRLDNMPALQRQFHFFVDGQY